MAPSGNKKVKQRTKLGRINIYLHLPPLILFVHLYNAQGILERLDSGEIVIGDGGFVFALEKRGYVKAGPWTPEATVEYPDAGTIPSNTVLAQRWRSL